MSLQMRPYDHCFSRYRRNHFRKNSSLCSLRRNQEILSLGRSRRPPPSHSSSSRIPAHRRRGREVQVNPSRQFVGGIQLLDALVYDYDDADDGTDAATLLCRWCGLFPFSYLLCYYYYSLFFRSCCIDKMMLCVVVVVLRSRSSSIPK